MVREAWAWRSLRIPELVMGSRCSSGACTIPKDIYSLPGYKNFFFFSCSKCSRSRAVHMDSHQMGACSFRSRLHPHLRFFQMDIPSSSSRRIRWPIRSNTDGRGADRRGSETGTRLVRILMSLWIKLKARIKELRKGFPMKLLFFLLGFYCATAFATVIGQTGDWDILSAGLTVVVVEMVGALMYRASFSIFVDRIRGVITMVNYWKAGVSLGLFLDAFKYEDDTILGSCNLFNIDIDFFPFLW